jgi:high-affinity nickel permease
MQEGKRPVAVGFIFFTWVLRHVIGGSCAIAGTAVAVQHGLESIRNVACLVGTLVSAFFLLEIVIVNLTALRSTGRVITVSNQSRGILFGFHRSCRAAGAILHVLLRCARNRE